MNVRSSIVTTVNQVRDAVRELQQAGVIAVANVPMRVEWGPGALAGEPFGGDVQILLAANDPDQPAATQQSNYAAEAERGSVASDGSPLSAPKSNASAVPCYTDQMLRELQVASRPLMNFLVKYHNPHVKAIVETHHVEVVEGLATEQRVEMDHHDLEE